MTVKFGDQMSGIEGSGFDRRAEVEGLLEVDESLLGRVYQAGVGTRFPEHNAGHLRTPMADRREPDPRGSREPPQRNLCGPLADCRPCRSAVKCVYDWRQ